jgi:hypothetical protein
MDEQQIAELEETMANAPVLAAQTLYERLVFDILPEQHRVFVTVSAGPDVHHYWVAPYAGDPPPEEHAPASVLANIGDVARMDCTAKEVRDVIADLEEVARAKEEAGRE